MWPINEQLPRPHTAQFTAVTLQHDGTLIYTSEAALLNFTVVYQLYAAFKCT